MPTILCAAGPPRLNKGKQTVTRRYTIEPVQDSEGFWLVFEDGTAMTFDLVSAARDPGCFAASLVNNAEEWHRVINDLISTVAAQQTKHETLQSQNEQLSKRYG